jgi:hypothetical protein
MSKNTYSYEVFLEVKQKNNFIIEEKLKESLETITKIIDNNYGISYHEKNNKHKHKNKQKEFKFNNDSDIWRSQKKTIIKKEINSDIDKYKYEINSLLNKLSPKNFDNISNKILEYYEKSLEEDDLNNLLISFIDSIFSKAVMQPIYCPYYVKFLNILEDKFQILNLIHSKCNNYREIFIISKDGKENMTEQEAYDKFCEDNLAKVFKSGYSQFIGELYNNKMIEIDIIKSNIDFFMTSLNDSLESQDLFENILICISQLIKTTSDQLQLINYKYKDLHDNLNNIYKNFNGGNRLKFKLLDLCEYISKLI